MVVLLLLTICISQGIHLTAGFDDLGDLDSGGAGLDLDSSSPGGAATGKKCPLHNVTNAVPATKERSVGSIMIYTCNKGFKKIGGDDARECLANGKWSGKDVVCQLITCPPAPNLPHADKVVTTPTNTSTAVLEIGSKATYTCKKYYNPSGNNTRICEKSGKWSKTSFECIHVPCPVPPKIKNARYRMTAGLKVGSVLTYRCGKFFKPLGTGVSTCLRNGTWSKVNFTCDGRCHPPPRYHRGAEIAGQAGNDFSIGTRVRYHCKPGYYPTWQNSSFARCLPSMRWSRPHIQCVDYTSTHANCLGRTISPVLRPKRQQGFLSCIRRCNKIPKCRSLFVDTAPNGQVRCFLKSHECPDRNLKCKGHPRFLLYRKVNHVNKSPNRPSVCYKLDHNNCAGRDLYDLGNKPQDVCLEECSQRPWCKSVQWLRWNPRAIQCWGKYYACKRRETGYRGDKRFHQFTKVPCSRSHKYRKPEGRTYRKYNLVEN